MLLNKMVLEGTDILLVIFAIYLFSCYFDIFFTRRKKRILAGIGYMVFVIWQFVLSSVSILPVYINISITIIVTFISVMFIYGKRLIFRYYQKNIRLLFSSRSTLTIHI